MSKVPRSRTSTNPPPPTASERAFERALAALRSEIGERGKRDGSDRTEPSSFVERAFARSREYLADRYATIGEASGFYTKLAGVSFEGRQDAIRGLTVGEALEIVRQPGNPFDPNAVAVFWGTLQIGFLNKGIARHIAPQMDAGFRYRARVESLTGVTRSDSGETERLRGVNVRVERDAGAMVVRRAEGSDGLRGAWDGDAQRVRRALIGEAVAHEAQQAVLDRIDAGRNTLAVMGTGRGKSFCFQFPAALRALSSGAKTLVIYPLRALANDQYEAMTRKLDPFGLRVYRANGSISHDERAELFEALRTGAWDIVLSTPEFLEFHREEFSERSTPALVVVDEAHHLFESKHRAAYGRLGQLIAGLGSPQVLALTATANDEAFPHIVRELRIDAWVVDPTIRENLHMHDAREAKDKIGYLHSLFADGDRGIVYCNSRKEATDVAEALRKRLGDIVMFYHAGMPTRDRHEVEGYFREGVLRVVVATSAFGEGVDLPDVRHVVLYHLNFDFTEFNQQAGRAGRDGADATIHLLFGNADRRINEYIIDREAPTLPVLRALYRGMRGLASDGVVRMNFTDIARTLDLDKVNDRTVSRALRIFEDVSLVEIAEDDEGRYVRFLPVSGKVDLEANERFAEGEAERDAFKRFCDLVLHADATALERIVNRPIFPQRVDLRR